MWELANGANATVATPVYYYTTKPHAPTLHYYSLVPPQEPRKETNHLRTCASQMSSMRMNLAMEELRLTTIWVSDWSMEDWDTRADSDS